MSDIKTTSRSFWDFFHRYAKLLTIGLIVLALVCVATAGALWWAYMKPIAVVDGKEITRADYNRAKEIADKTAEYLDDSSAATAEQVTSDLIERKIMDVIATEKGITVTDSEVNDQIESNLENKDFENEVSNVYETYGNAFGYKSDEFETAVYYNLLRSKIANEMISSRDGRYIYTRFNEGNGVEAITGLSTDKLDAWAKAEIEKMKAELDKGTSFDVVYDLAQNDVKYSYPAKYGTDFTEVNEATEGLESTEKDAILSLEEGKNSVIIKNTTYYAIYRVDAMNAGSYDTWEAMISAYRTKYLKNGIFGLVYANPTDKFVSMIASTFGVNDALAGSCAYCSGCHGARIHGRIYDVNTGANLGGSSVTVTGSKSFCEGISSRNAYCGNKSRSVSTSWSSAPYDNYDFGYRNGTSCFANCAGGPFRVYASRSGYYSNNSALVYPTNGSARTVHVGLTIIPVPVVNLVVNVAGTGTGSYSVSYGSTVLATDAISGSIFYSIPVNTSVNIVATGDENVEAIVTGGTNGNGGAAVLAPGSTTRIIVTPGTWATETATVTFTNRTPVTPAALSCSVSPQTGLSPLVVRVEAVVSNPDPSAVPYTFDYNMGDGTTLPGRSTPIYYTYSSAGTKNITVSTATITETCQIQVNVSDPSDGSGGEVNPN